MKRLCNMSVTSFSQLDSTWTYTQNPGNCYWVSAVFHRQLYLYIILFQCYFSCLKTSLRSDPSLVPSSFGAFPQWVVKFRLCRLTGQSPACSKSPLGPVLPTLWARPQPVPPSCANLTAAPPRTPWGTHLGVSLGSHARESGAVAFLPCACRSLYTGPLPLSHVT